MELLKEEVTMHVLCVLFASFTGVAQFIQAALPITGMDLMLGIDNLLVIGAMASALPAHERVRAIRVGLALAIVLRVICLVFATWIASSWVVMLLGGSYLLYLGWSHFSASGSKDETRATHDRFFRVIGSIGLADLSFSVDNIVGAVGISKDIWVVGTGVVIAMLAMMFASQLVSGFITEYPTLKDAAYVIIVLIGLKIFAETLLHVHLGEVVPLVTFLGIVSYAFAYDLGRKHGWRKAREFDAAREERTAEFAS